jgi:hypothetical protein
MRSMKRPRQSFSSRGKDVAAMNTFMIVVLPG